MHDRIASLDDYKRMRDTFRWDRPDEFNFGSDVIDRWAGTHPDNHALYWSCGDKLRTVPSSRLAPRGAPTCCPRSA